MIFFAGMFQMMTGYDFDPKNPPELSGVKGEVGAPGAPGQQGPPGIRVRETK